VHTGDCPCSYGGIALGGLACANRPAVKAGSNGGLDVEAADSHKKLGKLVGEVQAGG
jgi:hypothetical protein